MTSKEELVEQFLKDQGVRFRAVHVERAEPSASGSPIHDIYNVTMFRPGARRIHFKFKQPAGATERGEDPTPHQVLKKISVSPGSFGDFCAQYQFDSESGQEPYKNALKQWRMWSEFFTAKEIQTLREML